MAGHNCETRQCEIIHEPDGALTISHQCDGCGNMRPHRQWLVQPHPKWGWWHLDSCSPPHDWAGPGKEPS